MDRGRDNRFRRGPVCHSVTWDCAYPGVEVLPDGTIVTVTYGTWIKGEQPFIVAVRLRMEELDGKARPGAAPKGIQ